MKPLIPIPTSPDPSQAERLRPFVDGRACVVLGAAPGPAPSVSADEILIPVNGAISRLARVPDIWIVGSKYHDRADRINFRPLHKMMIEQAMGRSVGHLLLARGPEKATEAATLALLAKLHCTYQSWSVFDKVNKLAIEQHYCGRVDVKQPCSSGLLAVALCFATGAASVRMAGFSFQSGYFYIKQKQAPGWWRGHRDSDKRAIAALRARYGEKLSGDLVEAVAA